MAIVLAKHLPYDDGHLTAVLTAMRAMGPPIIHVVRHDCDWIALEGSHRLAACAVLAVNPILLAMEPDVSDDLAVFWTARKSSLPVYKFDSPIFTGLFSA